MRLFNRHIRIGAAALALASAAAACSGGGAQEPGTVQIAPGDAEVLGGKAAVDAMTGLYQAAQRAGQSEVVVYGPGEEDRRPAYDKFEERFPGIEVRGEFFVGPEMTSKINQEFATGKHIADIAQSGDTAIAPYLEQNRLEKFVPATAEGLDPSFRDPDSVVHSSSASTFGILYNTEQVEAAQAPKGWNDLLDPRWRGRMVMEDPTKFGGSFGTLNHLMFDGGYDERFVQRLSAQNVHLVATAAASGTAVATGEFPVAATYPYSFYIRDKAKGAPVEFVFPVDGGNHLSPHYLALLSGAPHPNAAKLLTWLFTPEGQRALADAGYYPTMPKGPAPGEYPPVDELELLEPFPIAKVNDISAENLAAVKEAFK
ncbi:MAG: extracellular solute-binding protein [Streptosporangiales bacterium]|nr:extracellular solute-binding protein [Streptosporangiales bacterium]